MKRLKLTLSALAAAAVIATGGGGAPMSAFADSNVVIGNAKRDGSQD